MSLINKQLPLTGWFAQVEQGAESMPPPASDCPSVPPASPLASPPSGLLPIPSPPRPAAIGPDGELLDPLAAALRAGLLSEIDGGAWVAMVQELGRGRQRQ